MNEMTGNRAYKLSVKDLKSHKQSLEEEKFQ